VTSSVEVASEVEVDNLVTQQQQQEQVGNQVRVENEKEIDDEQGNQINDQEGNQINVAKEDSDRVQQADQGKQSTNPPRIRTEIGDDREIYPGMGEGSDPSVLIGTRNENQTGQRRDSPRIRTEIDDDTHIYPGMGDESNASVLIRTRNENRRDEAHVNQNVNVNELPEDRPDPSNLCEDPQVRLPQIDSCQTGAVNEDNVNEEEANNENEEVANVNNENENQQLCYPFTYDNTGRVVRYGPAFRGVRRELMNQAVRRWETNREEAKEMARTRAADDEARAREAAAADARLAEAGLGRRVVGRVCNGLGRAFGACTRVVGRTASAVGRFCSNGAGSVCSALQQDAVAYAEHFLSMVNFTTTAIRTLAGNPLSMFMMLLLFMGPLELQQVGSGAARFLPVHGFESFQQVFRNDASRLVEFLQQQTTTLGTIAETPLTRYLRLAVANWRQVVPNTIWLGTLAARILQPERPLGTNNVNPSPIGTITFLERRPLVSVLLLYTWLRNADLWLGWFMRDPSVAGYMLTAAPQWYRNLIMYINAIRVWNGRNGRVNYR
jgi:hypothetical protein